MMRSLHGSSAFKLATYCVCLLGLSCPGVFTFQSAPLSRSSLFQDVQSTTRREQNFCLSRPIATRKQNAVRLNNSPVVSTAFAAIDAFWRNYPYVAAAFTCGFKASAADFVAQRRQYQEQIKEVPSGISEPAKADLQRNFAYIVYGSVYQGMAQEYIYNHLYPMFFGSGTDVVTVLSKVLFDLLVQTTLVTLPIAYISKALIYRYSFGEAMRRYVDDARNHGLLTKYFALWGPVQCLTFSIIPEHFRVTFIALVSFFWLIILSSIASRTPVVARVVRNDDECLLEDGQTCRIDG